MHEAIPSPVRLVHVGTVHAFLHFICFRGVFVLEISLCTTISKRIIIKIKKNIKEMTYVKSFSEIVCGKTKKNFDHRPLKELIYNMQNT